MLAEARAAEHDERELHLDLDDLLMIATTPSLRREMWQFCASTQTSAVMRDSLVEGIIDTVDRLDREASDADAYADLIDRSGLSVSGVAITTGLGLLITHTLIVGPAVLIVGGVIGLMVCGFGRTRFKRKAAANKKSAASLGRFYEFLRSPDR